MAAKRRYLVSAYYSDWIEAASVDEARAVLEDALIEDRIKLRDFIFEVQDEDDPIGDDS